jgi:hypothetical protein
MNALIWKVWFTQAKWQPIKGCMQKYCSRRTSVHRGGKWHDNQIGEAFGISTRTVERVRERLVREGLEPALNRAEPVRSRSRKIDGENEAHLIALMCGDAPEGRGRWTLRLLGQRMVELGYVESIAHETIRQALKKMN